MKKANNVEDSQMQKIQRMQKNDKAKNTMIAKI